ncbi:hypothetical protein IEO21_09535 [Rhodonia placenta]|uniref:Uncharacterized protein n=1 Tax=Rhodonia placenta TaxID=104341 RepID=A0A8H7TY55_9APHY|nr:hypothetical protein IEO21_09535 [Postia placenta]
MTAGPATSFRDLANLGWPIKQIFDRANAQRGGTMRSMSDLAINDGFAAKWGWYCYNIVKGGLRQANSPPSNISSTETVWSYDNSKNFQPHTEEWSESWTETTTVTASVTSRASISLNYSITIFNVASSGLSIEISTESTKSETKESVHQLSVTWPIEVGPGEILSINRTITRTTGTSVYEQDYGVSDIADANLCQVERSLLLVHGCELAPRQPNWYFEATGIYAVYLVQVHNCSHSPWAGTDECRAAEAYRDFHPHLRQGRDRQVHDGSSGRIRCARGQRVRSNVTWRRCASCTF